MESVGKIGRDFLLEFNDFLIFYGIMDKHCYKYEEAFSSIVEKGRKSILRGAYGLCYNDAINIEEVIMQELLHGAFLFVAYVIPAAVVMLTARRFLKIPDELFRKILHFILLGAYFPFLFGFNTWWISAGFAVGVMAIIYPILALAGKIPAFSSFVNERKKGEFKSSMILALATVAISISICWGIFDDKLLTLACVYAWGVGDAFAALVGKQFGKHKIKLPLADPCKSWEGSVAMFVSAVVSVVTVLLVRGGMEMGTCIFISLLAATATTYVELITKDGMDTITCPAVAMVVIIPLVEIMGG